MVYFFLSFIRNLRNLSLLRRLCGTMYNNRDIHVFRLFNVAVSVFSLYKHLRRKKFSFGAYSPGVRATEVHGEAPVWVWKKLKLFDIV